jgi:hypothetical protein
MEYKSTQERVKVAYRTTFLVRFGLLALTIYMLDGLLSELLVRIFRAFLGQDFVFADNVFVSIIFVALVIFIWYVILRIWEKRDFKYSFEWRIVNFVGRLRGRKSSRLKVDEVLYRPVCITDEDITASPDWNFPTEFLDYTELQHIWYRLKNTKQTLNDAVQAIKELPMNIRREVVEIFKRDLKDTEEVVCEDSLSDTKKIAPIKASGEETPK